jgi:hypothetical protein
MARLSVWMSIIMASRFTRPPRMTSRTSVESRHLSGDECNCRQLRQAGSGVTAATTEEAEAGRVAGLTKFADPRRIPSEVFYGPQMMFAKPFHSPRPIRASRPAPWDALILWCRWTVLTPA